MIFASETAAAVWREAWCDRCFHPAQSELRVTGKGLGCPILAFALATRSVPREMSRSGRDGLMRDAFRCSEFRDRPDVVGKHVVEDQTGVLF